MDRRTAIGLGMGLAAAVSHRAMADTVLSGDGAMLSDPKETIRLWPGIAPGGERLKLPAIRVSNRDPGAAPLDRYVDQVGSPSLMVFRPLKPDGSAMIIAPGGGYVREMLDFEGTDVARRFNAAGVTCFVLRYRLPGEGWANRGDVPLQDAQRAMRLVRANAAQYGVDPARIGFMGFSAGGHLAASIATRFAASVYTPLDAADTVDARPSFSVPMYPVITMGEGGHAGSRNNLLGASPTAEMVAKYSCEKNVPSDTPPTFLIQAADDITVLAVPNAIAYYAALRAANVAAEMHVFEEGGHGFSLLRAQGKPCSEWPELLLRWGAAKGFFRAV